VLEASSDIITRYFPDLSGERLARLEMLGGLYREWNTRINVISRQDIDNIYERHILHSLGIARFVQFKPGTGILDAGTGGGFPGIPLAIFFPEVHFHLVDSTAKKLSVVKAIADEIGLKNVTTEHGRLEDHRKRYDFVVSRAVASLEQMVGWTWKNISRVEKNDVSNGLLYLKGGTLEPMNNPLIHQEVYPLNMYFREPYFETKYLVHLF
jgi:16S rRNA (guanine527-N7)-methyltransferase